MWIYHQILKKLMAGSRANVVHLIEEQIFDYPLCAGRADIYGSTYLITHYVLGEQIFTGVHIWSESSPTEH